MERESIVPSPQSGGEVKLILDAERAGDPFLVLRDADDKLLAVGVGQEHFTIGRQETCHLSVNFDPQISRVHAELTRTGGQWIVSDQGLSRNGTFVDGERVVGRRRLIDGAIIRLGETTIIFRDPSDARGFDTTHVGTAASEAPELTNAQQKILVALSRPMLSADSGLAGPATNQEIADEVFLSVDAVKGHLRILFQKFAVADLPQNRKRMALVDRAIASGTVSAATIRRDG